jgi:tellurite resistance protein
MTLPPELFDISGFFLFFEVGVAIFLAQHMRGEGIVPSVTAVAAFGALTVFFLKPLLFLVLYPVFFFWGKMARHRSLDTTLIVHAVAFVIVNWIITGFPVLGLMLLPLFLAVALPPDFRIFRKSDERDQRDKVPVHEQKRVFMSDAVTRMIRRDPGFREDAFLRRAEAVWYAMHDCWNQGDFSRAMPLVSDGIYEQWQLSHREQKNLGLRREYRETGLFDARIAQMNSDEQFDTIHVYFNTRRKEYLQLGGPKGGDFETGYLEGTEYWSFSRRPTAKTLKKKGVLEGFCPNCSAPLEHGKAAICPVCQCFIRSGEYDWVLTGIATADDWAPVEPEEIPGTIELKQQDPGFSLSELIDRTTVIFRRRRLAESSGAIDPLARFVVDSFVFEPPAESGRGITRLDAVKVIGIDVGEVLSRAFLAVNWTFLPLEVDPDSPRSWDFPTEEYHQEIFILGRKAGAASDRNTTLTSSHCSSCGAPEKESFTRVCEYCNTTLNDASRCWMLLTVTDPMDQECRQFSRNVKKEVLNVPDVFARPDSQTDLIAVLIQVMLSDSRVDDRELEHLRAFANRRGFPAPRFNGIMSAVKNGWVHIPNPKTREDAREILATAVRMALIDEELSEAEMQTLNILAHHLGFSGADVRLMIARVRKAMLAEQKRCEPGLNEEIVRGMIAVMSADGKLADPEMQFLMGLAEKRGFPKERLLHLMDEGSAAGAVFQPLEKDDAMAVLRFGARMALIDGQVSPEETAVLEQIGGQMGYSPEDLRLIVGREARFLKEQRRRLAAELSLDAPTDDENSGH